MENKNIKIILLHGNGKSTINDHWFPYVKSELEKASFNVVACQFPDTYLARAAYWLPFLKKELKADENSILVGHSSGAIAAMRFAEENTILGSILIGSYYTDLDLQTEKLSGYFNKPWQWDMIRNNQQWIMLFASIDDPCISIEEPRFMHKQLKSEYYEFSDEGHFERDCNKSTFPKLLVEAIKKKLSLN